MSKRPRFAFSPIAVKTAAPFHSGEEAWFWFVRCQVIRHQGARLTGATSALTRPCEPDDIYRAVIRLHHQSILSAAHLRTLSQYGLAERSPDTRCPDEADASRLWDEAMRQIEDRLRAKGIIDDGSSDIP